MLPTPDDQVAISDLLARYCLTLDVDDVEGWVQLFLPDCRYEVYGRTWEGHEGLRAMMAAAPGGLHLGGLPVIEMTSPDRAKTARNLLVDIKRSATRPTHSIRREEVPGSLTTNASLVGPEAVPKAVKRPLPCASDSVTTARSTAGNASRTPSTSPHSTRIPRILTWRSALPRNWSRPLPV